MKKNLLLGVTGSIAASKTEELHSLLVDSYNIKIISTTEGLKYLSKNFITSQNVLSSWEDYPGSPHIELSRWADKVIIYPATANFIAKLSSGISDDLLLATMLMYKKSIYISPAMHEEMYLNKETQANITKLANNHIFCGPRYGKLDIGDQGLGRLLEPSEILKIINGNNEKVIVTAGPTYEKIDSVRGVTNSSSGKQGRAIAFELLSRGFEVTYIHSDNIDPVPHANNVKYNSSKDLNYEIINNIENVTKIYMTSAVSDFIPEIYKGKLSRKEGEMNIKLSPNIDIIKSIKEKYKDIKVIAFSAQLDDDLNYEKISDKNSDFLVINNLHTNDFGSDNNRVLIINQNSLIYESDNENKNIIAKHIIDNTL